MRLFVSQNRKREGAALKFLPLAKGLVVCAVIATIGFGYVWQKNSIYKLGDDIKQRELQLDALRKRNVVLVDQIASLTSPRVIEYKCKSWNLGLGIPHESQIVRVPDPMLMAPVSPRPPSREPVAPRAVAGVLSPSRRPLLANNRVGGRGAREGEVRAD